MRASLLGAIAAGGNSSFARFRAALAAVSAGTRNASVVWMGESTTRGVDQANCCSTYFINKLIARGYASHANAVMGTGGTGASLAAYDSRITFATPSEWSGNGSTIGHFLHQASNTGTSRQVFNPGVAWDRATIYYANSSNSTLAAYLDGSGTGAAYMGQTTSGALGTQQITTTLGAHTLELARSGGAQNAYFIGYVCWNSAAKSVINYNGGWSGGRAQDIASGAGGNYGSLPMLGVLVPDLTIINVGINDYASTSESTYKTNVQALIDKAKLTGDVLLMVPNPIYGTTSQATFRQYILDLGLLNNVPVLDMQARWGSYAAADANGYMFGMGDNGVHPIALGYADMTTAIDERLFA